MKGAGKLASPLLRRVGSSVVGRMASAGVNRLAETGLAKATGRLLSRALEVGNKPIGQLLRGRATSAAEGLAVREAETLAAREVESVALSEVESVASGVAGDNAGVLLDAGRSVSTEAAGAEVILDTNAVIRFGHVQEQGLLHMGETPVITKQVMTELNTLVSRGDLDGIPGIAKSLKVVDDVADFGTQSQLRQTMGMFSGNPRGPVVDLNTFRGLEGDAIIGNTGLATGRPIITADAIFENALTKVGGKGVVRRLK